MDKFTSPNNVVVTVLACTTAWYLLRFCVAQNRVLSWLYLAYGCVGLGFAWIFSDYPEQLSWELCVLVCAVPLAIAVFFWWMEREVGMLSESEGPTLPGTM